MDEKLLKEFEALPHPTMCRLINFDKAQVVPGIVAKTFFLIVTGTKPWFTMTVELHPRIYIIQPDYWGIEVIGCMHGVLIPIPAPYHVWLDISHVIGKTGIEVIGANKTEKIKVP
jgi:hypothetical protein